MKQTLKNLIRSFGLDIVKYNPIPLEQARAINNEQKGAAFLKMLVCHEIDLVFDVGANAGQFASYLLDIGYQGRIVSFEPLSTAYEQLQKKSQDHPQWIVAQQCALGDENGEVKINVAKNLESSSILPMLQAHIDAAPNSVYFQSEFVKVFKFDDLAPNYLENTKACLLKIDTQGYEDKILQGAKETLSKIKGLHLELSLVPLYEDQALFSEMLERVQNMGFSLYSIAPGFRDYRTGRLLQVMATFFRD